MNIVVFNPGPRYLSYALTEEDGRIISSVKSGQCYEREGYQQVLEKLKLFLQKENKKLDAIGIRIPYGGKQFNQPVMLNEQVKVDLRQLISAAPLHIPLVLIFITVCQEIMPDIPVVLDFETSFFIPLPEREHRYAINETLVGQEGIRRYGYQGIYHQAACTWIQKQEECKTTKKIISICLEPRSEVAGIIGERPMVITGGTTPLEGIIGEKNCGELDPSVIMTLIEKEGLGPEEINTILTRKSGLSGIIGEYKTLEEVLVSKSKKTQLAADMFNYKLLLACGSAIAALGGLDAIVFTGRYAKLGIIIGVWLKKQINLHGDSENWTWTIMNVEKATIIANKINSIIIKQRLQAANS